MRFPKLRTLPLAFAGIVALAGCLDDTTSVNESGVTQLAAGTSFPKCTKATAGDMVYSEDSSKIYYCADGEWLPLGGEGGTDTVVVRDTLVLSNVDTVFMSDTVLLVSGDTLTLSHVDTVVISKVDTVLGLGCTASALGDGSGYKILCGGDSVGFVKNGSDSESCTLSEYEDVQSARMILLQCGDDKVLLYGEWLSSSSSEETSSSSSVVTAGTGDFVTWTGSEGVYQIQTGFDQGDQTYGIWYSYNDEYDGGTSTISFPIAEGDSIDDNEWSYYDYNNNWVSVINYCGGVCGTAAIGSGYDYPYVAIGFNIGGGDQLGYDITNWNGLCIRYKSTGIAPYLEITPEDEATVTRYNNYKATLSKTSTEKLVNLAWSDFKQATGWGTKVDQSTVLASAAAIKFRIEATAGSTTDFSITQIGQYGRCSD